MRLTLTVVDPLGGATADVVLDADPESSVGDIAKELAEHVGYGGGAQIIPSDIIRGPRAAARRSRTSTGIPSIPPRPSPPRRCARAPS